MIENRPIAEPKEQPRGRIAVSIVITVLLAVGVVGVLWGAFDGVWTRSPNDMATENWELRGTLSALLAEFDDARANSDRAQQAISRQDSRLAAIEERILHLRDMTDTTFKSWRAMEAGASLATKGGVEDRDRILRIERVIEELENRFVALQSFRQRIVYRIQQGAILQVSALERAINRTGLDVDVLLDAENHGRSGKGGPFVAEGSRGRAEHDKTDVAYARLDAELSRLEALHTLIRQVPLVPPLDTFAINSSFGRRIDPVNRRYAFHEGVDLDAPRKSPVFATAAGTVVYAARKGNYGLFVEIDHGSGLRSGYAHMDEIVVKVGQAVRFGDEIGVVGNTGRSTGAHLHYEVKYRGEPMDPMDFIRAGRGIFQEDGDEVIPDDTFNAPLKRPTRRP